MYEGSAIDCLAKGFMYVYGGFFGLLALIVIAWTPIWIALEAWNAIKKWKYFPERSNKKSIKRG